MGIYVLVLINVSFASRLFPFTSHALHYMVRPFIHYTVSVDAAAAAAAADILCLVLSVLPVSCSVWCLVFMFDVLSSARSCCSMCLLISTCSFVRPPSWVIAVALAHVAVPVLRLAQAPLPCAAHATRTHTATCI